MTIKPATDSDIEMLTGYYGRCVNDHYVEITKDELGGLLARIRIERENAIKECLNAIDEYSSDDFNDDQWLDRAVIILYALLKAPSNQDKP